MVGWSNPKFGSGDNKFSHYSSAVSPIQLEVLDTAYFNLTSNRGSVKMKPSNSRKKLLSLLISQALIAPTQAAIINVNCGDVTELISAINTANSNNEADEINLNVDNQTNCVYPLTAVNNNTDGANGLPSITTPLTINGNQSAVQRQAGSPDFRIIHVASGVI